MTICHNCLKLLPGRHSIAELVLCKDCEKWLNPDRLKIKVPKFDEETIKEITEKLEKKKVLPD